MMRRTPTTWLAWATGGLSVALAVAAVVLAGRNGQSPAELVFNHHAIGIVTEIGVAVLGALIASHRPGNPIGWLMSLAALLIGVFSFCQQYAPLAVAEALPGVPLASWLATWTILPGISLTINTVFQPFPDGRLPSPPLAAAFQPLRRAIQRAVDRRFNRRHDDAAATIEAFAVRLRQQVDADALTAELLAVVDQTTQPTRASLWLRPAQHP
jgi:hypothetical protein